MGPTDIMQEFGGASQTAGTNGSTGEVQSAFASDTRRAMPVAKPHDNGNGLRPGWRRVFRAGVCAPIEMMNGMKETGPL